MGRYSRWGKVICFCCMLYLLLGSAGLAEEQEETVVRVGFYPAAAYQMVDKDGNYRGYSFDYLSEVAQYTGWQYEFVVAPFNECIEMLENGTIDILNGMAPTPEREATLEFSKYSTAQAQAALYATQSNNNLYYEDYVGLNGTTVGCLEGSGQNVYLDEYCVKNQITLNTQYFRNANDMERALIEGRVDAIFATSVGDASSFKVIARFEKQPLYFAVKKGSPYLEQLNQVVEQINQLSVDFEHDLNQQYSTYKKNYRPEFTREEAAYIAANPTVMVAYTPDWAPIEYVDEKTGEFNGIAADLFELLAESIDIEFKPYSDDGTLAEKLGKRSEHEIVLFPAVAHNYNWAGAQKLYLTNPYLNSSVVVVTLKNHYVQDGAVIALPKGYYISWQITQDMTGKEGTRIVYYKSPQECLDAVKAGKVDKTYVNNYVANYYLASFRYSQLAVAEVTGYSENLGIAISQDVDPILLSILNKGLLCISQADLDSIVIKNTLMQDKPSRWDILYLYPVEMALFLVISCFSLLMAIFNASKKRRLEEQQIRQRLLEKSKQDSLTKLYNKGGFYQECQAYLEQPDNTGGALVMLDLDNFKQLNDTLGHIRGDKVLQEVAAKLQNAFSNRDIVARFGGDEFCILLKEIPLDKLDDKLQWLVKQIKTCYTDVNSQHGVEITASIGVALFPEHGTEMEQLLMTADQALYYAKENGKNQYAYYKETLEVKGYHGQRK